jgi:hypothetical protein
MFQGHMPQNTTRSILSYITNMVIQHFIAYDSGLMQVSFDEKLVKSKVVLMLNELALHHKDLS